MQNTQASEFRRSSERRYRQTRDGTDTAYVLGRHDGMVLYNVEGPAGIHGNKYKHLYLDAATFDARWEV